MDTEQAIFRLLQDTRYYYIHDNTLTLQLGSAPISTY